MPHPVRDDSHIGRTPAPELTVQPSEASEMRQNQANPFEAMQDFAEEAQLDQIRSRRQAAAHKAFRGEFRSREPMPGPLSGLPLPKINAQSRVK